MPKARTYRGSVQRQKRIAKAYASGLSSERVAAMFGVSGYWVRFTARIYGVSRGYQGRKIEKRDEHGRFA